MQNASTMWGKKKNLENKGFTSMDWLGWTENREAVNARKMEYRRELEQLTAEKNLEKKKEKEQIQHDEKKVGRSLSTTKKFERLGESIV